MMEYLVSIEIEGQQQEIGAIRGNDSLDARFSYAPAYLAGTSARPVSLSLPLQEEAFSARRTRDFFEGLLPEGFTRMSVAQRLRIEETDYLSMLYALGQECLGALRIHREGEVTEAGYEPLTLEEVEALAAEGTRKSAELVTAAHLSLTGASGKVGLYFDRAGGKWYMPRGSAPSTHIVKQSHVRLEGIVANEQLALMTAGRCGVDTVDSFIINTGNGRDEEVLFATERFDRRFGPDQPRVSGLAVPARLHQEDFAQALGVSSARKYEAAGEHYLKDMFDLLRAHAAEPLADQLKLWDRVVFTCLVGNTDAHLKNAALLYDRALTGVRLAPAYDMLSTAIYEGSTRELAFHIGDARLLDEVTEASFRTAAAEIGIGERLAMSRFDRICEGFEAGLRESARELAEQGFGQARDLAERILRQQTLL